MFDHNPETARRAVSAFSENFEKIRREVGRMVVGQAHVVDGVLTALVAGGHVLLEGVPGLGKTMLVHSLAQAVDISFSRIQFTPDMMPADIIGTTMLVDAEGGGHSLTFQEGPIVAGLVLADEINRATPKTQSALLEVMQERQLTVGRRTIHMPDPFCVMATQNPVDQEGTYPLPEAQLDRFLFKLVVGYPAEEEYKTIIDRTTSGERVQIAAVADVEILRAMRATVRQVPVSDLAKSYAIRLVIATQPGSAYAPDIVNQSVSLGASPRGVQALMLAAKVRCLLDGRYAVSTDDVASAAHATLRHRIVTNFQAQASGTAPDQLIDAILTSVRRPNETDRSG